VIQQPTLPAWERKSTARLAGLCQAIGAIELARAQRTQELIRRLAAHPIGQQRPREIERIALGINSIAQSGPGARTSAVVYSPLDEASPVFRFDFQNAALFTESGGTLTSMTNEVSSVVLNTGTLPAYSATAFNGLPGLDFNGTTHHIMTTSDAPVLAAFATQTCTFYYAGNFDVADAFNTMFSVADSAQAINGSKRFGIFTTGAGRWNIAASSNAGVGVALDSAGGNTTAAHIGCWFQAATVASFQINNGSADPSGGAFNHGTITPTRWGFGGRVSSTVTAFFNGKWGEVLGFGATHDATARTNVHDYLALKWSI